jgi:hypothetical protein
MRKRIGEFLLEKELISQIQVEEILRHAQEKGLRFGDAALDLGFLSREKLIEVFGPSFAVDYFHVEPQYLPKITQDLFPVELMIRHGALALGYKTEHVFFRKQKMLNIGLLDPSRAETVQELLRVANEKLGQEPAQGVKVFLLLAAQFVQVLDAVYGTGEAKLRGHDLSEMDNTLALYLEHGHVKSAEISST